MIIDVLQKIDRGVWLIEPTYLWEMRDTVIKLASNVPLQRNEDPSDDLDDDELELEVPGFKEIAINGVLSNNPSLVEQLLGACDVNKVYSQIQEAGDDPTIDKILLCFNSPGGETSMIEELGQLISEVSQKKLVIAYVQGVCASAAYWLCSQANSVVTIKSARLGSIGVYSLLIDQSEKMEKEGVKVNAIISKKSPMKLAGAPFKPLTDEERAMFQEQVEKTDSKFREAVLSKRDIKSEHMDGRVFDGTEAVQFGYADGIVKDKNELYEMLLSE